MSLFEGMTAGFGQAQGQHNQKILDFMNQRQQTMASMYAHLAEQAQDHDQDLAAEFSRRAMGYSTTHPLFDPKGYKELQKSEKGGLGALIDQAHQKKVDDYHQSTFGVTPTAGVGDTNNPGGGFIPGSVSGQSGHGTPQPSMGQAQPQGTPDSATSGGPPPVDMLGQLDHVPSNLGGSPQAQQPAQAPPANQAMPPAPISTPQPPPMDMDTYVRHGLPPEPPQYGAMGRPTDAWKRWNEIYTKKMESTVATPSGMHPFIGSDFMPSGMASPMASMMRTEATAGARGLGNGFKLDPTTHQWVALQPNEYSALQNLRMAKDQSTIQLNTLTGQYKQAVARKDMILAGALLERVAIQKQNLARMEKETAFHVNGVDPTTGKPFPGQAMLDDGTGNYVPVGSGNYRTVMPTATEQNKAGAGVVVVQHGQNLVDFANNPNNADLFGRLQGRWEEFTAGKFGTNDPREAGLRADIRSMASLLSPLHGFRSQKAAEEFMTTLRQTNSPEAFAAAVERYMYMAQHIYDEGMTTVAGVNGQPVKRAPLKARELQNSGPPTGQPAQQDYVQAAMASGWDGKTYPVPAEITKKAEDLLRKQGKLK